MSTKAQKARAKAQAVRDGLVSDIIAAVQADPVGWSKSWTTSIGAAGLAMNASTGKAYRGGNQWVLTLTTMGQGFESNAWATYKQWTELGAQVRKGERSTTGIYWDRFTPKGAEPDADGKVRQVWFLKTFNLFNLAQVDVVDADAFQRANVPTPREVVEAEEYPGAEILDALPVEIRYGDPAYAPVQDFIRMPDVSDFESPARYAGVLAHEATHWTGHESRLNRPRHTKWGDDAYAFEELVAELGSVLFCGHVGIDHETRSDHVGYLQSWVGKLGNDPQALWTAATKASAAFEHLLSYSEAVEDAAAEDDGELIAA